MSCCNTCVLLEVNERFKLKAICNLLSKIYFLVSVSLSAFAKSEQCFVETHHKRNTEEDTHTWQVNIMRLNSKEENNDVQRKSG